MSTITDLLIIAKIIDTPGNRLQAVRLFIDAYYSQFSGISDNKEKLEQAFRNTLILDHFYGAYLNDELVGMYSLLGETDQWIEPNKKLFIKHIGFIKGRIVFPILRKEMVHNCILQEKGKYISTVATSVQHQGKGIATAMMKHAITTNEYLELDVIDTNEKAFHLYTKLGFVIFKEEPVKHFKRFVGFNKKIYMCYKKI